jgi:hypothetical protein
MSRDVSPPRWNGKKVRVNLTGTLLPFVNDEPFCLQVEGCDDFFIQPFTTKERPRQVMARLERKIGFKGHSIRVVTDPREVLLSVPDAGLRIMLDPHIVHDHHTKWLEVIRAEDERFYSVSAEAGVSCTARRRTAARGGGRSPPAGLAKPFSDASNSLPALRNDPH